MKVLAMLFFDQPASDSSQHFYNHTVEIMEVGKLIILQYICLNIQFLYYF
jgi:hypothetical protein